MRSGQSRIGRRSEQSSSFLGGLQLNEHQEWAEPLPDDCPPPEAWEPDNGVYYRLVDDPPTARNFVSDRVLRPQRRLKFVGECIARGLSIHDDADDCRQLMVTFPALREKQVAKVTLPPACGLVLQTTTTRSHHSWWLKAAFDPVSICEPL